LNSIGAPSGDPDAHGNSFLDNAPGHPDADSLAAYDLSTGAAVLMQTLDSSLVPSAEAATVDVIDYSFVSGFNTLEGLAISNAYADPLLSGTPVYLVNAVFSDGGSAPQASTLYRIPTDLSAAFDFMDGIRLRGYSILVTYFGGIFGPVDTLTY